MKIDVESMPIALPDGVDYDDYLVATYLVSYPSAVPVPKLAPALAIEQSTGTWVAVPGETPEVRRCHVAKVLGVSSGTGTHVPVDCYVGRFGEYPI